VKTAVKIGLGVTAGLLLIVFGTCGAGYLWLQSNSEELREAGKAAVREGQAWGRGKTGADCVNEGLTRLASVSGVVAEATNKVFVEACLKVSHVDDAFCMGVPPRNEIMQSATWALERCAALGKADDPACTRLVGAIQERCLSTTRPIAP
jgi:hypothetical protein